MSDFTYFILAMVFNHWWKALLVVALIVGWSDVMACTDSPDLIVINCMGCK